MDLIYYIKWESEHAGARPIHWYPKFLWMYLKYFMKSFSSRFLPEMSYSHLKMQKNKKNKKMERSKGRHGGEGCLDGMSGGRKSRVFKIWSKTSEQRFSQPYLQGCSSKRLIHPLNYRLSPSVIGGDSLRGVGTVSCFHCAEEEREMRVSQVEQKPSPTSHTCQKVNPQLRPHC